MIEESLVALLHVHEILPRGEIAHAGPGLALGAFRYLLVPRPGRRFGFHQPVIHPVSPIVMPGLSRPSTSSFSALSKTWMPATRCLKTRFALLRRHDDEASSRACYIHHTTTEL